MFARIAEITPNNAWSDLLQRHLGQVVDEIGSGACSPRQTMGPIDLAESDTAFILTTDVPGISAEQVDLSLDLRRLTIRAEREIKRDESLRPVLQERRNGILERTLILPKAVVSDEITATVADGVLTITMPKSAEVTPRKIKVN